MRKIRSSKYSYILHGTMPSVWLVTLEVLFIIVTVLPNLSDFVLAQELYPRKAEGHQPLVHPPPVPKSLPVAASWSADLPPVVDIKTDDDDDVDSNYVYGPRDGNIPTYGENRDIVAFFQGSCDSLASCEQVCIESYHGYLCTCHDDYYLNNDGFSCTRGKEPTHSEILQFNNRNFTLDNVDEKLKLKPSDVYLEVDGSIKGNKHGSESLNSDPVDKSYNISKGNQLQTAKENNLEAPEKANVTGKDEKLSLVNPDPKRPVKENNLEAPEKANAKGKDEKLSLVNPDPKRPSGNDEVEFLTETSNVTWLQICGKYPCQKKSVCVVEGNEPRCECPLGTTGKYCEEEIVVRYPKLNGRGYLAFPLLRDAYEQFRIYLEIKPESADGLLLFESEKLDARGDFFSIVLIDGHVEFRFDCGKGIVAIRSVGRAQLNHWNSIFVVREGQNGLVQLNSEKGVRGKSETVYSRITLRQDLYLGGFKNMSAISRRVGTRQKFSGCIQELVINSHRYDMRKAHIVGNALHGTNVMECSTNVCTAVVCENHGKCAVKSADTHICLCPLGYVGSNCETKTSLHVPRFNSHSYLKYPGLDRSTLSFTEVEMIIKPTSLDGLILYNGFTLNRKGDFFMLAMSGGYLEFRFDLGTGPAIIRTPHAVSLDNWHIVKLSRTGRDGILEVDNQPRAEGLSQGAFTQLSLMQDLYIGGHQNFDEISKYANISTSFSGCIQKVVINEKPLNLFTSAKEGVNINNCDHPCQGKPCMNSGVCVPRHDNYSCYCPLGFQGNNCQKKNEKINDAQFSGNSYLMYQSKDFFKRTRGKKIDIQMWVKPEKRDGLLFWVGKEQKSAFSDYLAIGFVQSILQFRYNLGSGEVIISYNATNFFDGSWHFVRVQRDKQDGYLLVDNQFVFEGSSPGTFSSLNTDKRVFIGGVPNIIQHTRRRFSTGFHGCITDFTLGTDMKVELVEQADVGQNVWQCS